jgi:hypothetical protein
MYPKAPHTFGMFLSSLVDVSQGKAELVLHACWCNQHIFCKM